MRSGPLRSWLAIGLALGAVTLVASARAEESSPADLAPGTWSGGRPPECNPDGQGNVWERSKEVSSADYCRRLAEGAAVLAGSGG